MRAAKRLEALPPYLFTALDRKVSEARAAGVDVINLGIGDPDRPTPEGVVRGLQEYAADPAYHRYPSYIGALCFRTAVASYYYRRFGVSLDPESQVMALIGSKEGIGHIIWAFADPGDVVLVPDPAYPVYQAHTVLAGAEPYPVPLLPEKGFLPDLNNIPPAVARRAKILFLNYPNNPTGAVADEAFFREAVAFCRQYDILLCHDAAYAEITYDGFVAPSVLQVPGAMDVAVEFNSLSKPFNMTGWRLGMAVGNAHALAALGKIKTNTDSGQFTAIQMAGADALQPEFDRFVAGMRTLYERRRDRVVAALRDAGWEVTPPRGAFYIWLRVPDRWSSQEFALRLLERAGVMVSPGSGFGAAGEGYVRLSLTVPDERLDEACARIVKVGRHL